MSYPLSHLPECRDEWSLWWLHADHELFSERARVALAVSGITRRQLSEHLGCCRTSLGDLIAARDEPKFHIVLRFCDEVGMPFETLCKQEPIDLTKI